jgi:hypothetical protein
MAALTEAAAYTCHDIGARRQPSSVAQYAYRELRTPGRVFLLREKEFYPALRGG